MDMVLEVVDMILFPIAEPLKIILDAILKLVDLVIRLVLFIPDFLMTAVKIFDPVAILNDIIVGVFTGIKLVLKSIADIFTSGPSYNYNKCSDTGEGLFGYRRERDENGNLIVSADKKAKNRTCVNPTILNLAIVILCPPLGLGQHLGSKGFFHVLVCAFLTVKAYYFPGLIYAVMHMIC